MFLGQPYFISEGGNSISPNCNAIMQYDKRDSNKYFLVFDNVHTLSLLIFFYSFFLCYALVKNTQNKPLFNSAFGFGE